MEFKDRLKELRNELRFSAPLLAKELGKAESTVRMWEMGRAKPDVDTLIKLPRMFNCSVDYLLGLSLCKNEIEKSEVNREIEIIGHFIEKMPKKDKEDFLKMLNDVFFSYSDLVNLPRLQTEFKYMLKNFIGSTQALTFYITSKVSIDYNTGRTHTTVPVNLNELSKWRNLQISMLNEFHNCFEVIIKSILPEDTKNNSDSEIRGLQLLLRRWGIENAT